jgi:D-alanine-D-alanine ligase-like ATP-grasp enzyme
MARKVTVQLVDDLDGGPADATIAFGLDGAQYEIDLSAANAAALRDALAQYVGAARRVGRGTRGAAGAGDTAKVREWAKSQGLAVSERGRIAADVRAAYDRAH